MLHHHAAVLLLISTLASAHAILQPLSSSSRLAEERVHQNFLDERLRPPAGTLGPPAHLARCAVICCRTGAIYYHLTFATPTLNRLHVGNSVLSASRRCSVTGTTVDVQILRLASRPECFAINGLLSERECDDIIATADAQGMEAARSAGGDARHNCGVAWLPIDSYDTGASIAAACEQLLLRPEAQHPSGDWAQHACFENMQVLRYGDGGEFKLHHDANQQTIRTLTVLLYLNGVGSTWFPLASEAWVDHNPTPSQAFAAAHGLHPARDGLLVSPSKGDAIAFYNFCDDGSGELDRLALHAGLPASAEKSVAALWYSLY